MKGFIDKMKESNIKRTIGIVAYLRAKEIDTEEEARAQSHYAVARYAIRKFVDGLPETFKDGDFVDNKTIEDFVNMAPGNTIEAVFKKVFKFTMEEDVAKYISEMVNSEIDHYELIKPKNKSMTEYVKDHIDNELHKRLFVKIGLEYISKPNRK